MSGERILAKQASWQTAIIPHTMMLLSYACWQILPKVICKVRLWERTACVMLCLSAPATLSSSEAGWRLLCISHPGHFRMETKEKGLPRFLIPTLTVAWSWRDLTPWGSCSLDIDLYFIRPFVCQGLCYLLWLEMVFQGLSFSFFTVITT